MTDHARSRSRFATDSDPGASGAALGHRAGVRLGVILSNIFGRNGRTLLDGLATGTGRELLLASLTAHVAHKLEDPGEALCLSLGWNDRFMLGDLLEEYDAIGRRIDAYTRQTEEQMTPWEAQLRLLTTNSFSRSLQIPFLPM